MLRIAGEQGVSAEDALVMATLHPAQYHGLRHLGAIAPGYQADIVVLDDLRTFQPRLVLKRGAAPAFAPIAVPEWARQTVHIIPVDASSFAVPIEPGNGTPTARVIRVIPGQLLTACEPVEMTLRDG